MGRRSLAVCGSVTEVRVCEEATGNGEWLVWVGGSSCLETNWGRGAREAVGTFGLKKLTI